jgi:hypothetical protein
MSVTTATPSIVIGSSDSSRRWPHRRRQNTASALTLTRETKVALFVVAALTCPVLTRLYDPVISTGHQYAAQVQQPINPDNTSVWPAKRGVIPVRSK